MYRVYFEAVCEVTVIQLGKVPSLLKYFCFYKCQNKV